MNEQDICQEFSIHPVRKVCKNCRNPREDHPISEEDVEQTRKFIKALSEQPEIKPHEIYAWTPPQCPRERYEEYFSKFAEDKVPKHNSGGQKNRLKLLTYQIPLSDLVEENYRFADPESKADLEAFTQMLQNTILRLGIVKEWCEGMPVQCPKCLLVFEPRELIVLSAESGPAFHPTCFVCFQCNENLTDLIHCSDIDGAVFCIRHYCDNKRKRCHTCDELIFSSRYALAGENFYHRDHLLCFECDELLEGNKGYEKDWELYCASCYENKFCKDCVKCKKKITLESRHVTYKDDNWHCDCVSCNGCHVLLSDSPFEIVDDKFFCMECYNKDYAPKCEGCHMVFDPHSKVVKYEDKIYHVPCFKCVDCEQSIGTGSFVPHKGRVYCKACHLRNFGVRCFRCKYAITEERGITYNKEPYHEDCFTCYRCNGKIATKPFKSVDDSWYCLNCYGEKFCKKCHACEEPILLGADQDVLYSYEDYRWHAACFTCSVCKKSLADTPFMMREKVLVCKSCIHEDDVRASQEKIAKTEQKGEQDQSKTVTQL